MASNQFEYDKGASGGNAWKLHKPNFRNSFLALPENCTINFQVMQIETRTTTSKWILNSISQIQTLSYSEDVC